ncbi:MAG: FIG01124339: hypothetical protein, partial [uncultured Nocardioidaceae bacterium]
DLRRQVRRGGAVAGGADPVRPRVDVRCAGRGRRERWPQAGGARAGDVRRVGAVVARGARRWEPARLPPARGLGPLPRGGDTAPRFRDRRLLASCRRASGPVGAGHRSRAWAATPGVGAWSARSVPM